MNNSKILGILGSGDLGQLIAHHALNYCNFNKIIFFDDFAKPNTMINNILVYGGTKEVFSAFEKKEITHVIIGIGYKHIELRKNIFEALNGKIAFASIIHPTANIDKTCKIGNGVVILPGCILDMNVEIQDNVLLNTGCIIAHDSIVMQHSFLSPNVALAGFVSIGSCCNIGISTTVIDNIKIQNLIQTGGSTVVIRNLNEKGLYVGNPARFIR